MWVLPVSSIFEKNYDSNNDIWGEPQTYKKVLFYPLKLRQQSEYDILCNLFTFAKDQIADANIGRMSYIKFMMCIMPQFQIFQNNRDLTGDFIKLLETITEQEILILHNQPDGYDPYYNLNQLNKLKFTIKIGDTLLSEQDIEVVREIVLTQNNISLDYIKEYDKELEENLYFLYKKNDASTLEEEIFSFSAAMKIPIYEIKEKYTIYQFHKTIQRLNLLEDYESFKPLESAGFITLKKGEIPHWLSHVPKKGRYDDLLIKKETFIKDNDIFKVSQNK